MATAPSTPTPRPAPPFLCDEIFKLPDGRTLGVRDIGAQNGLPLLFFPHLGATRDWADPLAPAASRQGVRLVTVERPGFGASTFAPGRSLTDWAADVRCLAEARGLRRFGILGAQNGGPHALACASALPEGMVSAVGLCSSPAPWALTAPSTSARARIMAAVSRHWPSARAALIGVPAGFLDDILKARRELSDKALRDAGDLGLRKYLGDGEGSMTERERAERLLRSMNVLRSEGGLLEERLVVSPWGFRLEDVGPVPVRLWHDVTDMGTPIAAARLMAEHLPYATLRESMGGASNLLVLNRELIFSEMALMMKGGGAAVRFPVYARAMRQPRSGYKN